MLVKLRRNWFAPDGVRYKARDGLVEIANELKDELPSDAVILSEGGTLPSKGVPAKPGFGAKPDFEQVLDQIPYAAPTHQITAGGGQQPSDGLHPPKEPVEPATTLVAAQIERPISEAEQKRFDNEVKARDEAVEAQAGRVDEARAAVAKGLGDAKVMEDEKADGDPTRKSQIQTDSAPVQEKAPEPKKK